MTPRTIALTTARLLAIPAAAFLAALLIAALGPANKANAGVFIVLVALAAADIGGGIDLLSRALGDDCDCPDA